MRVELTNFYRKEMRRNMAGIATKAADNVLYNARMAAQAGNDRLGSRESAAEIMGIDRTRLARMELGMLTPYPEEILLMAETYNAPELMNHFCTCECPIGKRMIPRAELIQLDRLTIKILNALDGARDVGTTMRQIADCERVDEADLPKIQEAMEALQKVAKVAAEMQIWMEKHAKGYLG